LLYHVLSDEGKTLKHNATIKYIKSLNLKKNRDRFNKFIIEGIKFVSEIPKSYEIEYIIVAKSKYEVYKKYFYALTCKSEKIISIDDNIFSGLSDTKKPQGIMAVCEKKTIALENIFDVNYKTLQTTLIVVADNINDPGNLGTLIRSCVAFKVYALLLSKNSVDVYNPKVLRASAGNIFHLNIVQNVDMNKAFHLFREHNFQILATTVASGKNCSKFNFKSRCVLIIGNEANGISKYILSCADDFIKIPTEINNESLNVSVAASIILYQIYSNNLIQ
jgi:TrmH family RNA methyltransferase